MSSSGLVLLLELELLSGPVPGVLLSGPVPGVLLSGAGSSVAGAVASSAVMTPSARRAVNVARVLSVWSCAVRSAAVGCSRRTVNHPGCGAKATMRSTPPLVSRMTVADSPATTENWVAEPATGVGVSGCVDAGVDVGLLPGLVLAADESVEPLPGVLDELDADADTGMPRLTMAFPPTMPAVANAAPMDRVLAR